MTIPIDRVNPVAMSDRRMPMPRTEVLNLKELNGSTYVVNFTNMLISYKRGYFFGHFFH
jgi:hypothetical protein